MLGHAIALQTRRAYGYRPVVDRLADELAAFQRYEEEAGIAACRPAIGYHTPRLGAEVGAPS